MKDCLIIGPTFATTYPEVVKLFKYKMMQGGYTTIYYYDDEQGSTIRVGECFWYTSIKVDNRQKKRKIVPRILYDPGKYKTFDNYPAIEVNSYKNIPIDYDGLMGVPNSIIVRGNGDYDYDIVDGPLRPKLNGKTKFPRLIIRRKQL